MAEDMNVDIVTQVQTTTFVLDKSKIEVFVGQHFLHQQEHVDTLLDMDKVAFTLTIKKPNSAAPIKELEQWNQVIRFVVTPY